MGVLSFSPREQVEPGAVISRSCLSFHVAQPGAAEAFLLPHSQPR